MSNEGGDLVGNLNGGVLLEAVDASAMATCGLVGRQAVRLGRRRAVLVRGGCAC